MKRFLISIFTLVAILAGADAFARGSADKVTGDFTHGNCGECGPGHELLFISHKLISAQEGHGNRPQKGFLFSWNDNGRWFEMDFRDTNNTCVHVDMDGHVRTGGLVSDGNGAQVGRYFGLEFSDNGEPAYFVDDGATIRFSRDYWSEAARIAFLDWCETGLLPGPDAGLNGLAVWPNVIIKGNVQVHNSPGDGD